MNAGKDRLEIAPATHFACGGVRIDENASTCIPGLLAAGEVTGGTHGANRLSSNGLTDALVFGLVAAETAVGMSKRPIRSIDNCAVQRDYLEAQASDIHRVRNLMLRYAGMAREKEGLQKGLQGLEECWEKVSAANEKITPLLGRMLATAQAVMEAALLREETRGAHCRLDFPVTLPQASYYSICIRRGAKERPMASRISGK